MKFKVMRLTLCSLLVVLAACSGIGIDSKKIDYKSSSAKVPTLEIPPDLTSPTLGMIVSPCRMAGMDGDVFYIRRGTFTASPGAAERCLAASR